MRIHQDDSKKVTRRPHKSKQEDGRVRHKSGTYDLWNLVFSNRLNFGA
jgi:hypothetical protein